MEQYSGRENTYKFFLGERDRYREKGRQGYREEKREIKGSRKKRSWPLRKTDFFLTSQKMPKKNMDTKLEGDGGKTLVAWPLKNYFFAASLIQLPVTRCSPKHIIAPDLINL